MILVFWHVTIVIEEIAIHLLDIADMVFTEEIAIHLLDIADMIFTEEDIIECILHTTIVEVVFQVIDIEADALARSAFLFGSS